MMKRFVQTTILFLFSFFSIFGQTALTSPNGKISVDVNIINQQTYGKPAVSISYKNNGRNATLFENILIGLKTNQQNYTEDLKLIFVSKSKKIKDNYTMLTGKRSKCINYANEKVFKFENRKGEVWSFFAFYNDGVALVSDK